MLVCNCNGISEREVKAAVRHGAERWHDVHEYYECAPACGKCACDIADVIADHRESTGALESPGARENTDSKVLPSFGDQGLAAAT